MNQSKPILFVDDDASALAAFRCGLRGQFTVDVAQGPHHGLQAVTTRGPFAVVVADMRMPVMNGVRFLQRVHELAPETTRIMLTGNADLQTAMEAVNEAGVFQFLAKPCPRARLVKALTAAIAHYDLVSTEHELLDKTLKGCVKVLTEVLSLVNPLAFGRAMRMADTVRHLAALGWARDAWKFELAALLSQIGGVTLSAAVLEAAETGKALNDEDQRRFAAHPLVAHDLIAQIPRLDEVAVMIVRQHESHGTDNAGHKSGAPDADRVALGARMLRLAHDLDVLHSTGVPHDEAIARLRNTHGEYDPRLLMRLSTATEPISEERASVRVSLDALEVGMEVQDDVRTATGLRLLSAGQTVTPALKQRLGNFLRLDAVFGTVRVLTASAAHATPLSV